MPVTDSEGSKQAQSSGEDVRQATFEQFRGLLFSIAYRMLGSVADAEDMVQEAYIRWRKAGGDEIRNPRSYLVTIVSRLCINYLQSARVQREQYVGQWLPEPIVTGLANHRICLARIDESVSMAFLVLLERLAPVERAVFLLREVFEYEYGEIASILQQNETNCRQILHRARQHVAAMRPRFKASAEKQTKLLEGFLRAITTGDISALIALLSEDVILHTDGGGKAVAVPNLINGASNVARAIILGCEKFRPKDESQLRIAWVNATPGVVGYLNGKPSFALAMDADEQHIHAIYFITNPDKLSHLPDFFQLKRYPEASENSSALTGR